MNAVESHVLLYRHADGTTIQLTVPWGYQSGRIPPPAISFWENGQPRDFVYAGSK
jgi:hypothetical protein